MHRLESRLPWFFAFALLLSSPWVLRDPRRRFPYEDWAAFGVTLLERPLSLGSMVFAHGKGSSVTFPMERSPEFELYKRALADTLLPKNTKRKLRLLLPVRGAQGQGAGGAPKGLRLVVPEGLKDYKVLEGLPAVFGESFVGRIEATKKDGLLLRFPWAKSKEGNPERLIAQARSQKKGQFPSLELIVEPAGTKDPFPLRVALANPNQAQTWTADRYPYWVRIGESRELHPDLPSGLLLGVLEDEGYPQTGFVLRRFVRPLFDPRALPVVAVLLPRGSEIAKGIPLPWEREPRTVKVEILWRSPRRLGVLRYLVKGGHPHRGDALFSGGRLRWVYDWAKEGLGMAVPAFAKGVRLPALALSKGGKPRALLLRGEGMDAEGHGLFSAPSLPGGKEKLYQGGWIFTGVAGKGFPAGLVVGKVKSLRGPLFVLETPKNPGSDLFVVAGRRER